MEDAQNGNAMCTLPTSMAPDGGGGGGLVRAMVLLKGENSGHGYPPIGMGPDGGGFLVERDRVPNVWFHVKRVGGARFEVGFKQVMRGKPRRPIMIQRVTLVLVAHCSNVVNIVWKNTPQASCNSKTQASTALFANADEECDVA